MIRDPRFYLSLDSTLHFVCDAAPTTLVLHITNREKNDLVDIRINVRIKQQTLVGEDKFQTESDHKDGKQVTDRILIDVEEVQERIRRGDEKLFQSWHAQVVIERTMRVILDERTVGNYDDTRK